MFELLIVLAIYTIIVLFFVPLQHISNLQMKVKKTVGKWLKAIRD